MSEPDPGTAPDDDPIVPPVLLSEQIDPLHRLGASILLGAALSVPTLRGAVSGDTSLAQGAWMFGVAMVVAWLMVWLVWAVWHLYRSQHDAEIWHQYEEAEAARLERLAEAERLAAEALELEAEEQEARQSLEAAEEERLVDAARLQRELDELVVDTAVGAVEADRPMTAPATLQEALGTSIVPADVLPVVRDAPAESR